MKKLMLIVVSSLLVTGCSNGTYDKAIENAKLALASGEFNEAMALSQLALEEKPEDEEATAIYTNVELLNEVKELIEAENWEIVLKKMEEIEKVKDLPYSLAQELKNYNQLAMESQGNEQMLSDQLKEVETLLADHENEEAKVLMERLQKDETLKTAAAGRSEEMGSLLMEITNAIQKEADDKKAEAEKEAVVANEKEEAAEEKAELAKAEKSQPADLKKIYLNKLAQIEISLNDLDYLYADGITSQMIEGEAETLKRWDDALNEIYAVLIEQLSSSDMARLREEQRDWILYRDYEADLAASEFAGGSFEGVQRLSTLGQLTKDRCYLLVDYYLN